MSDAQVIHLAAQTMLITAKLGAPILLTALFIGFAISLIQTLTQIQEVTLSFVPKIIGVGIAVLASGNWMLHELVTFTVTLYQHIPVLLGRG
jgi:flagellar biosynthesis protein FliQ